MRKVVGAVLAASALFFSLMTLGAQLFPCSVRPVMEGRGSFDPSLATVDSLDEAEAYVRRQLGSNPTQAQIADEIERFLRLRFFHDLTTFSFCANWIAVMSGAAWDDLAAPVRPEDLMRYRRAQCNQQTMLFQALLKRFGIDYATVRFRDQHMAVAARVEGTWALYDSDIEFRREGIVPISDVLQGDVLVGLYGGFPGTPRRGYGGNLGLQFQALAQRELITVRGINEYPAPQGAIFHAVTDFLSRYGWLMLAVLAVWLLVPRGRAYSSVEAKRGNAYKEA